MTCSRQFVGGRPSSRLALGWSLILPVTLEKCDLRQFSYFIIARGSELRSRRCPPSLSFIGLCAKPLCPRTDSRDVIHAVFQRRVAHGGSELEADTSVVEFARCFLRLANLPNFALDRLSHYEASFWCQARRILFMLDALDRRKPQGHKKEKIGFGTSTIRNWARACTHKMSAFGGVKRTSQIRPVMSAFDP
jgi:hypothetical protein